MDIEITITIQPSFMGTREYTLKWDDPENEYVMLTKKWKDSNPRGELDIERRTVLRYSKAHSVLWRLDRAKVDIYPDGTVDVYDGTQYTLAIRKGMNQANFSWYHDLPHQWSAFQEIMEFIYKYDNQQGEA